MVNVVSIPDGLEDSIAETKNEEVLDRLFTEVMIDAIDLILAQHLAKFSIQGAGGIKVMTEGFLDDDASPAIVLLLGKSCRA